MASCLDSQLADLLLVEKVLTNIQTERLVSSSPCSKEHCIHGLRGPAGGQSGREEPAADRSARASQPDDGADVPPDSPRDASPEVQEPRAAAHEKADDEAAEAGLSGKQDAVAEPGEAAEETRTEAGDADGAAESGDIIESGKALEGDYTPAGDQPPRPQVTAVTVAFGAAFDERVISNRPARRPGSSEKQERDPDEAPQQSGLKVPPVDLSMPGSLDLPPYDLISSGATTGARSENLDPDSAGGGGGLYGAKPGMEAPDLSPVASLSDHASATGEESFEGEDGGKPQGIIAGSSLPEQERPSEAEGKQREQSPSRDADAEPGRRETGGLQEKEKGRKGSARAKKKSVSSRSSEKAGPDLLDISRVLAGNRKILVIGAVAVVAVLLLAAAVVTFGSSRSAPTPQPLAQDPLDPDQLHPSLRQFAAPAVGGWWKITMWVNKPGQGNVEFFNFKARIDQHHTNIEGSGADNSGKFVISGKVEPGDQQTISFTKSYQSAGKGAVPPAINFEGAIGGSPGTIAAGDFFARLRRSTSVLQSSRASMIRGTWSAVACEAPGAMENLITSLSTRPPDQQQSQPARPPASKGAGSFNMTLIGIVFAVIVTAYMMVKHRPEKVEPEESEEDEDED